MNKGKSTVYKFDSGNLVEIKEEREDEIINSLLRYVSLTNKENDIFIYIPIKERREKRSIIEAIYKHMKHSEENLPKDNGKIYLVSALSELLRQKETISPILSFLWEDEPDEMNPPMKTILFGSSSYHETLPEKVQNIKETLEFLNRFPGWKWKILIVDDDFKNEEQGKNLKKFYKNFFSHLLRVNNSEKILVEGKVFEDLATTPWHQLIDYDFIFVDLLEEETLKGKEVLEKLKLYKDINIVPLIFGFSKLSREDIRVSLLRDLDYFFNKGEFLFQIPFHFLYIVEQIINNKMPEEPGIDYKKIGENIIFLYAKEPPKYENIAFIHKLISAELGEYKKIYAYHIPEGYGGADKFKIEVDTERGTTAPFFLKIDEKDDLSFERFAYHRYIKGRIDNFTGRISERIVRFKGKSSILYSGVASWKDYLAKNGLLTFGDFLENPQLSEENDQNMIKEYIKKIFGDVIFPLHNTKYSPSSQGGASNPSEPELYSLLAFYEPRLPYKREISENQLGDGEDAYEIIKTRIKEGKLELKIRNLKDNKTFVIKLTNFPENKNYLQAFLRKGKRISLKIKDLNNNHKLFLNVEKFKDKLPKDFPGKEGKEAVENLLKEEFENLEIANELLEKIPITVSVIHGDFNLRNIMIAPRSGTVWLIDFDRTKRGHLAFDFTELEITLRNFVLATYLKRAFLREYKGRSFSKEELKNTLYKDYFRPVEEAIKEPDETQVKKKLEGILKNLNDLEQRALIRTVLAIKYSRDFAFSHYFTTQHQAFEYWASLALFALSTLKFSDMYDPKHKEGAPLTALWMLWLAKEWIPKKEKVYVLKQKNVG